MEWHEERQQGLSLDALLELAGKVNDWKPEDGDIIASERFVGRVKRSPVYIHVGRRRIAHFWSTKYAFDLSAEANEFRVGRILVNGENRESEMLFPRSELSLSPWASLYDKVFVKYDKVSTEDFKKIENCFETAEDRYFALEEKQRKIAFKSAKGRLSDRT